MVGRRIVVAGIAACLIGAVVAARTPQRANERRVLFIGNSLTTANNLPGIVEALAGAGGCRLSARVVAFNDYSLEDHWSRGEAVTAIRQGGWTHVVLQQGPSALPESQVLLRDFTQRFDVEVRKAGARTALYMVWPSLARKGDFPGVSRSYTNAARDVLGILLPAGDAWQAAWQRDASLPLYAPDNFHPSPMGSYLAALVTVGRLCDISPIGLPAPGMPPAAARILQAAAAIR